MKLTFKTVAHPTLILFAICLSVSLLLGITNELTMGQIAAAEKKSEEDSRKIVLSTAETFVPTAHDTCVAGMQGDEIVGYVFVTESKGYGGTIRVMTGIGLDSNIQGVVILTQNETPGLGANATQENFTNQYKGPAEVLSVTKGTAAPGQIQAMTGATITTSAVTKAVNLAVELFETVKGGA